MAARSYPAPYWSEDGHRPQFRSSYEWHGYLWIYGALAHREDRAFIQTAQARNTESWMGFLDDLEGFVPVREVYLIADGTSAGKARRLPLPLQWTVDTKLRHWGHPRFHFVPVPKAAAWLNLIDGLWKVPTQRSLH